MRILFLGRPGRTAVKKHIAAIRAEVGADLIMANAENASGGLGLSDGFRSADSLCRTPVPPALLMPPAESGQKR